MVLMCLYKNKHEKKIILIYFQAKRTFEKHDISQYQTHLKLRVW
jgi:hypothetical protein